MYVLIGSNERSRPVDNGKINPNFQKWKFVEIWHIQKFAEICCAANPDKIKEKGTFTPFSPYKKANDPN